jgi:hypothetical protein
VLVAAGTALLGCSGPKKPRSDPPTIDHQRYEAPQAPQVEMQPDAAVDAPAPITAPQMAPPPPQAPQIASPPPQINPPPQAKPPQAKSKQVKDSIKPQAIPPQVAPKEAPQPQSTPILVDPFDR